jgi:Domain of unknown function (DUF5615)
MRFPADMGVPIRVVEWLRDQGHDARHLREEELLALQNRVGREGRTPHSQRLMNN